MHMYAQIYGYRSNHFENNKNSEIPKWLTMKMIVKEFYDLAVVRERLKHLADMQK